MTITNPFPVTPVFEWNYTATEQTVINQGGTNSGKTFSIMQVLLMRAIQTPRTRILVTSDTLRSLKSGAIRDLESIIHTIPFFEQYLDDVNKSDFKYTLTNGSFIEFGVFTSVYLAQKAGKREYLFVNEPNHYPYEIFEQLWIRTTKQTFIDYNPRTSFWAHDKLIGQDDVKLIISNYKDNGYFDSSGKWISFVPESIARKIESNKEKGYHSDGSIKDEYHANQWRVYGLGLTGSLQNVIFDNVKWIPALPTDNIKRTVYGVDFGYSVDPTTVVKVVYSQGEIFAELLLYETGLTNQQISAEFERLGIKKGLRSGDLIIADSAEPKSISELRREGWHVRPCKKGKDSIKYSISKIKQYGTLNLVSNEKWKHEQRSYVWVLDKRDSTPVNRPVDRDNHIWDAFRYAVQGLERRTDSGINYR